MDFNSIKNRISSNFKGKEELKNNELGYSKPSASLNNGSTFFSKLRSKSFNKGNNFGFSKKPSAERMPANAMISSEVTGILVGAVSYAFSSIDESEIDKTIILLRAVSEGNLDGSRLYELAKGDNAFRAWSPAIDSFKKMQVDGSVKQKKLKELQEKAAGLISEDVTKISLNHLSSESLLKKLLEGEDKSIKIEEVVEKLHVFKNLVKDFKNAEKEDEYIKKLSVENKLVLNRKKGHTVSDYISVKGISEEIEESKNKKNDSGLSPEIKVVDIKETSHKESNSDEDPFFYYKMYNNIK